MNARALLVIAVLALAVAVLLVMVGFPRQAPLSSPPPLASPPPSQVEEEPAAIAAPPHFGEVCARHQYRVCDGGDAWWIDSCGRREGRAQRCDDSYCEAGQCVAPSPGPVCAGLSEGGRCEGEVLRWCEHGRARRVDCAAEGLHCGRGPRGEPNCVKPARCKEDVCRLDRVGICEEGQLRVTSCRGGASCELDEHKRARCVQHVDNDWPERQPCHGCACASPGPGPEEELPAIPVVAFLVSDEPGYTEESEERARLEVEVLKYWFRSTGLRFYLRDVKKIVRPRWLSASDSQISLSRYDEELHPRDQPFFVPVVFVRDLKVGVKGAAGVGTLPGGNCAELSPLPDSLEDDGAIFVARLRNLTTLAHELGHYFGLCHTHQADPAPPHLVVKKDGTPLECGACGQLGDGVCDTPVDPGLDNCTLDEERCVASCPGGAAPDPSNLMSYFVPCRRVFTDEQAAWMRRYARLRLRSR